MLFGDKKEFAIEIKFEENRQYAHILLYVSNIYIGTPDEITYIESCMASIEGEFIDRMITLPEKYINLSCREIFNLRYPDDEWSDWPKELDNFTISGLEDTFDPFSMIAYKISDNEIIFCWTLWSEYFRDKNYPKGIHSSKLNYTYVKNVVNECAKYVSKISKS